MLALALVLRTVAPFGVCRRPLLRPRAALSRPPPQQRLQSAGFTLPLPRRNALRATEDDIAFILEGDDWDDDDDDDGDFEAELHARAAAEHAIYEDVQVPLGVPYPSAAQAVRRDGVALLDECLCIGECEQLRQAVLGARDKAVAAVRKGAPSADHLSAVLGAAEPGDAPTRFDVRLPYEGVVEASAKKLLGGALGAVFEELVGADGELWELAALVSEPGAPPQAAHADTVWDAAPCLYTAFVALQDVDAELGPTRFFPGTHATPDAEAALDDDAVGFMRGAAANSRVALLNSGAASIYDGRVVHSGGPNDAYYALSPSRAMFYVTFRHPDADADDLGNADAHSISPALAARGLRLRDFR